MVDSPDVKQAAAIGQIGSAPFKAPDNGVPPRANSPFSDPFQDKGGAAVLQTPKVNDSPATKSPFDLGPSVDGAKEGRRIDENYQRSVEIAAVGRS